MYPRAPSRQLKQDPRDFDWYNRQKIHRKQPPQSSDFLRRTAHDPDSSALPEKVTDHVAEFSTLDPVNSYPMVQATRARNYCYQRAAGTSTIQQVLRKQRKM